MLTVANVELPTIQCDECSAYYSAELPVVAFSARGNTVYLCGICLQRHAEYILFGDLKPEPLVTSS